MRRRTPRHTFEDLLTSWARLNPSFYNDHDPEHGNETHATAAELLTAVQTWLESGDDNVEYDGPELTAAFVESQLDELLAAQQTHGATHGISDGRREPRGELARADGLLWLVVGSVPV